MGDLAKDAAAARAAGMSYGKWMAMQEPVEIKPKTEKRPVCLECGNPLRGQQKKFCSRECQEINYNKRRRG